MENKLYHIQIATPSKRFWITKKAISAGAAKAITRLARNWEIVALEEV